MDSFERQLKEGFLEEVEQLLLDAEKCFLDLETEVDSRSTIEKIFRIAHNIKGSARAVGFDDLGHFAHEFENYLLKIKSGEIGLQPSVVDLLLKSNDHIKACVDLLRKDFGATLDASHLFAQMRTPGNSESPVREPMNSEETVSNGDPVASLPPERARPHASQSKGEEVIRVSLGRLDKLLNAVGELSILQTVLEETTKESSSDMLRRLVIQIHKVGKEVQDLSMGLRMIPIKHTFQKMQRIVRDTAAALNKDIHFKLEGEETEVDKTLLEAIGDPLVHLVRNAVDHGVEDNEARRRAGKSSAGQIDLRAYHRSGRLIIEVQDDGAGINGRVLQEKARERGVLSAGKILSEQEAVNLIFHPGFSTKAEVSEISGRGVGMDVVKTNIESLQGEVQVETHEGKGTLFRLTLPLTLAIIEGLILECAEVRYVAPLAQIHETVRVLPGMLHHSVELGTVLRLRGEVLPAVMLSEMFGKKSLSTTTEAQIALIVQAAGHSVALLVKDVLRQQQVVVKSLGRELTGVRGISASAILGDGKPALILELNELVALEAKGPHRGRTRSPEVA